MNKDLYIELLEAKISEQDKALITLGDKVIELQKKLEESDKKANLVKDIVDMVNREEDSLYHEFKLWTELVEDDTMYRFKWCGVYDLAKQINKLYDERG